MCDCKVGVVERERRLRMRDVDCICRASRGSRLCWYDLPEGSRTSSVSPRRTSLIEHWTAIPLVFFSQPETSGGGTLNSWALRSILRSPMLWREIDRRVSYLPTCAKFLVTIDVLRPCGPLVLGRTSDRGSNAGLGPLRPPPPLDSGLRDSGYLDPKPNSFLLFQPGVLQTCLSLVLYCQGCCHCQGQD